jgi:uncharacterized protein DUF6285
VIHGRPTAAELVAAVAEFLETDVREATRHDAEHVNFHARVAANVLRIVERELLAGTEAPELLGFDDERALAAAIRAGELDGRATEVDVVLRELVLRRLAVSHPGYENP